MSAYTQSQVELLLKWAIIISHYLTLVPAKTLKISNSCSKPLVVKVWLWTNSSSVTLNILRNATQRPSWGLLSPNSREWDHLPQMLTCWFTHMAMLYWLTTQISKEMQGKQLNLVDMPVPVVENSGAPLGSGTTENDPSKPLAVTPILHHCSQWLDLTALQILSPVTPNCKQYQVQ